MNVLKDIVRRTLGDSAIKYAKLMLYSSKGEPIAYAGHRLRYVVGTRPVRMEYLNAADVTTRNDAKQLKFFLDHVKEGDIVLDIGGHNGQYAVLFSSLVGPRGAVVTFEPDECAIKILRRNLALNPCTTNVTVEKLALADKSGSHSFFSRGGDSMSSLARSGLGSNATATDVTEHTVETIALDDYLIAKQLGFPQWVKLDTEGAEVTILRGARKLLKSGTVVVCELHPYAWKEFGTSFEELLEIVSESGRTIEYLDGDLKIADGAVYGAVIIS